MATRGCYTFKDEYNEHHVYKHWDNYPTGALEFIQNALNKSWKLPRFEANEFGASFIACNKEREGDLRLTSNFKLHGDLDYRYEISAKDSNLYIKVYAKKYTKIADDNFKAVWSLQNEGTLNELKKVYQSMEGQ